MNFDDDINDAQNIKYQYRGVKEILNSLLQTPIGIHQIVVYPNKYEVLREAYFYYIKKLLEDNNEIVIFLTYYESADSVKNVLSSFSITTINNIKNKDNNKKQEENQQQGIDIKKYINNGSLVIIESDKAFSNIVKEEEEEEKTTTTAKINNNQIDKDGNNNNDRINNNNNNNVINNNNFSSLIRMSLSHAKKLKKEGITILADYGFIYNKNGFEGLLELEKSIPHTFNNIKIKQICLYNQNDFFHKFTKQQKKEILDFHSRSIIMMDS